MDDLGNIGGLDKTGQGGGSYGNYYLPFRQKQSSKQEPQKLKQGEIVIGTVIEIIDKDIAKVKLPMGTYNAYLHNKLMQGDTLFLFVSEVSPSLVLRVHSVTSSSGGKQRSAKDIQRLLDLPDKSYVDEVVEYLAEKKSQILRSEVLTFISALEKISYDERKYNKTAIFKAIFMLIIGANQTESLVQSFYPVFLPLADAFQILEMPVKKVSDNSECLLHLNFDFSLEVSAFDSHCERYIKAVCDYNKFATLNYQPVVFLFSLAFQEKFIVFRCELLTEKKESYLQNNAAQAALSFPPIFEKLILSDKMQMILSKDMKEIEKESEYIIKFLSNELNRYGTVVSYFSVIDNSLEEIKLIDGVLKATPRNFSIVV